MKIYEDKIDFGWDGDNGLGDRLIQQIIDGIKTATCSFKIEYSQKELEQIFAGKGKIATVINREGKPKCNIRIVDVFETPFGNPDMRLVRGEGDGENINKFKEDHKIAWENTVKYSPLTDDTILIAEVFELVDIEI